MNKQIKNLLMEARLFCYTDGTVSLYGETYCGQPEIERFAELIVEQCAKHAEHAKGTDVEFETYFKAMVLGVEEPQGWVCHKCGTDRTQSACPLGHTAAITGDCPMYGVTQSSDSSWITNPDRMGGSFTQDEIDEANSWK